EGTIIFVTLDGSDPAGSGAAAVYSGPFAVSVPVTVRARARRDPGGEWSALSEASFVPDPDTDGDGIPDSVEAGYRLDPRNPDDAGLDHDGDGLSTLAEFLFGTDPRDAADRFRVDIVRSEAGDSLVF